MMSTLVMQSLGGKIIGFMKLASSSIFLDVYLDTSRNQCPVSVSMTFKLTHMSSDKAPLVSLAAVHAASCYLSCCLMAAPLFSVQSRLLLTRHNQLTS